MTSASGGTPAFAPAAERNAAPLLEVLRPALRAHRKVLEIGSGTGQHAVHFARAMPWLQWQCSDVTAHLADIRAQLVAAALPNTPPPLALDVAEPWPSLRCDAVFSANTLHIMSWSQVKALFRGLDTVIEPGGVLLIYGPFRQQAHPFAPSNAVFDAHLRAQAAHQGIRDLADVDALAAAIGLHREQCTAMPANNLCVRWRRLPPGDPLRPTGGGEAESRT